jgi:hypothetical protein
MDRLAALNRGKDSIPADVVEADIRRGRRARRRRRARIGVAVTAAVLAGAGISANMTLGGAAGQSASAGHAQHPAIQLVDYNGPQEPGFRITKVPQGFGLALQASTPAKLVIARSGDQSSPDNFVGKIVIIAEDLPPSELQAGRQVTVNGARGAIIHPDPEATTVLFPAHRLTITVQAWNSIGLTDQQLIKFSDGVTVSDDVQPSHG